jgi:hypothetical protein
MAEILLTALEKALEVGAHHLNEAHQEVKRARKHNVAACIRYIEAARSAIQGLEDEPDEILIEAGRVARYHWKKRSKLYKRIEQYLNRKRLSKILADSFKGIETCKKFADKDAAGFWGKRLKKDAVKRLEELLESMKCYGAALFGVMEWVPENFVGQSGINMAELLQVKALLDDRQLGVGDEAARREKIANLVDHVQKTRKDRGSSLAAEAKGVIQELTVAFRLERIGEPARPHRKLG